MEIVAEIAAMAGANPMIPLAILLLCGGGAVLAWPVLAGDGGRSDLKRRLRLDDAGPRAAVTDAKGNFSIDKLPAGKHEFRIWHEKVGYIERKYSVTVKAGDETKLDVVKVAPSKFK